MSPTQGAGRGQQISNPAGGMGPPGPPGTPGAPGLNSFTTTTAPGVQPAALATVTLAVVDSTWAVINQIVFLQTGGYYVVTAKPTSSSVTLQNLGTVGNVAPGSPISGELGPAGVEGPTGATGAPGAPGAPGAAGLDSFTIATSPPGVDIQPAALATVTIDVVDSTWAVINQIVFLQTGGYYVVTAKPTSSSVTLQNLGTVGNVAPGSPISGELGPAGVPGATGATGAPGAAGLDSFTTTTAAGVQPAALATVTLAVVDSTWAVIGQAVFLQTGGYYVVTAKPTSSSVTLQNLDYPGNVAVGGAISGQLGPAGPRGTSAVLGQWFTDVAPLIPNAADVEFVTVNPLATFDPGGVLAAAPVVVNRQLLQRTAGSGIKWFGSYEAVPDPEFDAWTKVGHGGQVGNAQSCGLFIGDANVLAAPTIAQFATVEIGCVGSFALGDIRARPWANYLSPGGAYGASGGGTLRGYVRILSKTVATVTTITLWYSSGDDGADWLQMGTIAQVLPFTAAYIGLGGFNNSGVASQFYYDWLRYLGTGPGSAALVNGAPPVRPGRYIA